MQQTTNQGCLQYASLATAAAVARSDEIGNTRHEVTRVVEFREEEEGMDAVRILQQRDVLAAAHQHLAVSPLPVLQRVVAADDEQHWRERRGVYAASCLRGGEARGLVRTVRAGREERAPHPIGAGDGHDRRAVEAELGRRPLLAAKEGLDGDDAGETDALESWGVRCVASCDVVRDVAAGAVPGEEATGGVQRDVGEVVLGVVEEADGSHAVVVGRREAVLRGAAVVDGEHGRRGVPRDAAAHGVVGQGRRGEEREPAAVEEDDHGERPGACWSGGRVEEAGADAEGWVDDDVAGGDAPARGGEGRDARVQEGEHTSVHGAIRAAGGVGDVVHGLEG
ncbi:unnamed protein product [Alopecurus aequalis]